MTNKNPSHLPRSAHSPFPCPFCGEKTGQGPTLALGPNVEWISKDKRRAGCGCGARGPIKDNDVEAIDSWNCIVSSVNAHASLVERVKELEKALKAVEDLISNSRGVVGLHLNGDEARWDELREGGRFEEWLVDFDAALSGGAP